MPLLRAEGVATNNPVTVCQVSDGTIVEAFEWEADAEQDHVNPVVLKLWDRYANACEYVPPGYIVRVLRAVCSVRSAKL